MRQLIQKIRTLLNTKAMRYLVIGGCTTLVNFAVYTPLCKVFHVDVNVSNVISITCAILFAYVTNKKFVFRSHCDSTGALLLEFFKFVSARLFTMAIEIGGVFLLYNILHRDEMIAKLIAQVIVLISNYIISEFLVFRKTKKE